MEEQLPSHSILQKLSQNKPNIRNSYDAIAIVLHCFMKESFLCVGCGDNDDESEKSMFVPSNWASSDDSYTFRYKYKNPVRNNKTFLLKIVVLGDKLLVHGLILEDQSINLTLEINVKDFVNTKESFSNFPKLYKNLDNLLMLFQLNIVNEILPQKEVPNRYDNFDPLRIPTRPSPLMEPSRIGSYPQNPFGIGSNDLFPDFGNPLFQGGRGDPLFQGGGGNLIGPTHPGFGPSINDPFGQYPRGRPPQGYPRGARFDPYGPSIPGNTFPTPNPNPDPNEPPPPGFENMYL